MQLSRIFRELKKGHDRRIRQHEAELDLLERGKRITARAQELDPSLEDLTIVEAARYSPRQGDEGRKAL